MTLKEADAAAMKCLPVIYDGIKYRRITQIGYKYSAAGRREFIQLADWNENSVIDADPKLCTVTLDFSNK